MTSCAGCRAVAGPATRHMVRIGGLDGPVFHPGCVTCGGCKKELVVPSGATADCVRNAETKQPWHAACVTAASLHTPVAVEAIALQRSDAKPGRVGELLLSAGFAEATRSLVATINDNTVLAGNDFIKQRLGTLERRATNIQALDLAAALKSG